MSQDIKDIARDFLIEGKFNIRPGDSTKDGLVVDYPHVKLEIDDYLNSEESKRFSALLEKERLRARQEQLNRLNTMFSSMTWGHYDPFSLIRNELTEVEKQIEERHE